MAFSQGFSKAIST